MIFPPEELAVIDLTVRMFTQPVLEADIELLGKVWTDEARRKREAMAALGVTEKELQSSTLFAELLRGEGIEPPTKDGKNGPIYCFAKTDTFMQEGLEHEDERTRTLFEARLGVRSTIDQTRAERLGFMAQRGAMPVYLGYALAHTTRWGGGDKVNWQNFKRGGDIRKAIKAPAGHAIIKADKSQIECRILNYVAGQWDVIEKFRNREDPYVGIASQFYGRTITKSDPAERGTGKQLELSCGYGAGGPTIQRTAARGTYGPPVRLSEAQAIAARDLYRATHPAVVALWKEAGRMISHLAGSAVPCQWGPATVVGAWNGVHGHIVLPNGAPIWYPSLEYHREPEGAEEYWRYKSRKGWVKLYGAKLVENFIQALSRIDISQAMLRLNARGLRTVLTEHDAIAVVVPSTDIDKSVETVREEMTRAPAWLPGIPLDCDVSVGERYS